MKVGLFFGSFNPIHVGHLILANVAVESTDLNKVCFVVSPQNPFKKRSSLLHEFDRLDMVRAAIHDNPNFEVSDIEFHLPQPSYTIDTLTYLQEKYPKRRFALLMGEDNLAHFHKWKNYEQILEYYELYVYPRPHTPEHGFREHPKVHYIEAPLLDISATYIRQCIQEGRSIRYMVTEPVAELIYSRKYYH
ncbi:nicotinate-nucleotide adenylyltransferase [Thermonema lapsum]|uniref:Probable nicotinate-nucleotide adenylyltransferase n=1 Tax=Thermonema lapsum TaxID=28195 RepID=A0A846MPL6_9BACT|nr:nicotinate (nicotinamide) nucleotide adenylyltransferase [Thermonema lapsum]NIK73257.1 nicotinate-nucleotide adenylyltransferase [Thermonema lapsum]